MPCCVCVCGYIHAYTEGSKGIRRVAASVAAAAGFRYE